MDQKSERKDFILSEVMFRWLFASTFFLVLTACLRPPEYPVSPEITFDSISTTFAVEGQDSITFYIGFTDGDGDLGDDSIPGLFFTDSRTGFTDSLVFPYITPEGNIKAISGVISYTRSRFDCIPGKTADTLYYRIFVQDRSGNASNEVASPDIFLDCN